MCERDYRTKEFGNGPSGAQHVDISSTDPILYNASWSSDVNQKVYLKDVTFGQCHDCIGTFENAQFATQTDAHDGWQRNRYFGEASKTYDLL